ncbi:MAG TPA: gamma-glutamyl-gamma-aminobutyrate hydrolase family protein [Coleofasciculaceae cyanobacterium]|jgi:GMP synthase (glutamine-hydrolysing)
MSILIVRHVPGNTLGPLEAVLAERGLPIEYVQARKLTERHLALEGLRGLVILGGRESLTEDYKYDYLLREQAMVREAIAQELPIFGICLGSQMIARSLGAPVERNRVNGVAVQEIGWTPITLNAAGKADPVLSQLDGLPQFQWHEDRYHLPPGAVNLAHSALCPEQAYRLGKPGSKVYAVQFHPEMSQELITTWLDESETLPPERKQAIREETDRHFNAAHAASRRMFEAYCDLAY